MKTKIFLLLLLILPVFTVLGYSQTTNKLYIPTVESGLGKDISIPIYLTNDAAIVAAQFKMHFPENTIVNPSSVTLSDRKVDHTVSIKSLGNNDYLFVIFSAKNTELRGNSGILLRVTAKVPETWTIGSNYPFTLNQIILSILNGDNVATVSDPGSIKVVSEPRPDVTVQNVTVDQQNVLPLEKLNIGWQVNNVGDKITGGGWSEQVSLMNDNGEQVLLGTTNYDQLLDASSIVSRQAEFLVPEYPGMDGTAKVQVKVIPNSTLGELITAQSNNVGLSDGTISIDKRLNLTLAAKSIQENNPALILCRLFRSGSRAIDQTFTLRTDSPDRLKIPESVTIKAGQSGAVFYVNSIDNKVLNIDSTVVIFAKGIGYSEISDSLTIIDDEIPSLKITSSKNELNEGDSFTFIIEREIVTNSALKVNLSTDYSKRFGLSSEVTIPANEKSITVNASAVDDAIPALTVNPIFTASAYGYTKATCSVSLADNDVPVISLSIAPGTVSESAGYQAAVGVVRRQGSTDNVITIKLSDDSNGGIYYSTPMITLEKGVSEKQFTVGVVDNALVDGNRDVAITAAVYISTCGCSASGTGAGVVQSKLTVLDDDGPSLKITSLQTMLPEGKSQATLLMISRNTSTTQLLAFTLSSDRDADMTYQKAVTIPAGSTSVTIPVDVINNNTTEGDRTVTFTASADGFTKGVCWAMITDQTLADATVNLLSVTPANPLAKGTIQSEVLVTNSGVAALAAHTSVDIYLCNNPSLSSSSTKQLLTTLYTSKDIAPQGNESLVASVILPDLTGQYYLIAQVNAAQTQKELSYLNNVSEAQSLKLLPSYKVNVTTDKNTYKPGEVVGLSGKAIAQGGSSVSGVAVEVYVINNGYRQSLKATTDAAGAFQVNFTPYSGQMGHFVAGACYPNEALTNEQTSFDFYGLKCTSSDYIKWEVLTNEPTTGEIELINPGNLPLTDLKSTVQSTANGWQLAFDPIPTMGAGGTVKLKYTITGNVSSTSTDWEQIKFQVSSAEGALLDLNAYYYCRSPKASLKASLSSIQTTMTKGDTRTYQFTITNNGKGASGKISVMIPATSWLSLVTPAEMPSLGYGESATVVLQLAPSDDMIAHTSVTGSIGINCENGSGIPLAFNIETVSEKTGTLTVDVCDEYTYYTSQAPHLAGAKVVVKHPFTGAVISQGTTDANGLFSVDNLPEGYYMVVVTADKHDSYTNNILVDPGKTTKTTVNLSFQAITYTWNVVETEVKDVYTTETVVKYETNVPVPVVEVLFPKNLEYEDQVFSIVATNKGLIAAQNVTIALPQLNEISFELLSQNPIESLAPQQSTIFYVKMKINKQSRLKVAGPQHIIGCIAGAIGLYYTWYCGLEDKLGAAMANYTWGECSSIFPYISGGSGPGGSSGPGGPGGGWKDVVNPVVNTNIPTIERNCDGCANEFKLKFVDCIVGSIPGFGCGWGIGRCASGWTSKTDKEKTWCSLTTLPGCLGFDDGGVGCLIGLLDPCDRLLKSAKVNTLTKSANATGGYPSYISSFQERLRFAHEEYQEILNLKKYYFGDDVWLTCNESELNAFYSIFLSLNPLENSISFENLINSKPTNIEDETLIKFINRWNNTRYLLNGKTNADPNFVDLKVVDSQMSKINDYEQIAINYGYGSMSELVETEITKLNDKVKESSSSVCASISLQFSQTMTITRQAFRGTLSVYNGHETDAMKNVQLNLVVKDSEGNIAGSQLFQVNTENLDKLTAIDGTGTLNAKETGTANILFIPTKYAAPLVSKAYTFGGTLSYLDPFTGLVVTRDLYPVTLTVKPSPDLKLTYFMQRDVLGDDPLTTDVVEPSEPAEFSLLINNLGAGDATNVKFSSAQPQVVQNDKGLLTDFKMIGSSLNGAEKTLGWGNLDFGNILAGKTSIGQWWFTNNLLGHFTEYNTTVTHVTSYDNPDLSLVSDVSVHELIRSLNVPSTTGTALTGFLANDIPDGDDAPDMLYLSDGNVEEVNPVSAAVSTKTSDIAYSLTVTPSKLGWNYGVVSDPGNGHLKLISVVRQRDNASISLRNFWQTNRTLRDGKDPLYENRIHFADNFAYVDETYVLTFEPKPDKMLEVEAITGVSESLVTSPVAKVTVRFNKPIDASTFTSDDITLKCQSVAVDISKLKIVTVSPSEYTIDFSTVTGSEGYYLLTVQTNKITDTEGYQGENGKQAGWTQHLSGDVQLAIQIQPEASGIVTPTTGNYAYGALASFTAQPTTGYTFKNWTLDGQVIESTTKLNHLSTENKTIVANFEAINCKVTIDYDATQGTVSGGTTSVYQYGNQLTLTATPATNYDFVGWYTNGVLTKTEKTLSVSVNSDISVEVKFIKRPVVTWINPDDIVYGTTMSKTQLNATADVSGTFTYIPALGSKLSAGNNQELKVDFTPTDAANYENISKTVTINVKKATPIIAWSNPDDIVCGTILSEIQLNATADVAGAFAYTPISGTKLDTGNNQKLNVKFIPKDLDDYEPISKVVVININPAVLSVSTNSVVIIADEKNPISVDVESNASWLANSDQLWLKITPISGKNNATLLLVADENTGNKRAATITVTSSFANSQTISVSQLAKGVTDIEATQNEKIRLCPNPTKDAFSVSGIIGVAILKLLDINGRLLLSKQVANNESVSVSSLPQGMYIVKLITTEGITESKIIKK
jgi:hypothetical protein